MADQIEAYLEELRAAMAGSDPALINDAVYDAAEFLRDVVAAAPDPSAEGVVAAAIDEYGSATEIATAYLEIEETVVGAMRTPTPGAPDGRLGRFFSVLGSPREWAALAYLLTAAATGFVYFFLAVGGAALTGALLVFVIGIPFGLLYLGTTRAVSLVEGRIVEVLVGERMPRRPLLGPVGEGWLARFKHWVTNRRTWTTLVYLAAQLPLGIAYLAVFGGGLLVSMWAVVGPVLQVTADIPFIGKGDSRGTEVFLHGAAIPLVMFIGVVAIPVLFRLARFTAGWHGRYAKWMLVGSLKTSDEG